ncbi:hypothetical protein KUD11_00005, partial [Roseovarius sp. LXJ103]|nr:hypothetical protein [Roseovarius carneus]
MEQRVQAVPSLSVNVPFTCQQRWVKAGAFHCLFKEMTSDADLEYAMIDGAIVKVHRSGQGAKGGLFARPSIAREGAFSWWHNDED